ncbi:hypothetical protein EE612_043712, partial [Oryza sativa]
NPLRSSIFKHLDQKETVAQHLRRSKWTYYYSKGHSNSKPKQHGTTNHGNSYKENNGQSTASSYYNGSSCRIKSQELSQPEGG